MLMCSLSTPLSLRLLLAYALVGAVVPVYGVMTQRQGILFRQVFARFLDFCRVYRPYELFRHLRLACRNQRYVERPRYLELSSNRQMGAAARIGFLSGVRG